MPEKMKKELKKEAKKKGYKPGSKKFNEYVYGTMQKKTNWKPSKKKKK